MKTRSLFLAGTALFLGTPALAASHVPDAAVSLEAMVRGVAIPHKAFTLGNGLRVIVHTDRSAPVVAVGVWYDVGSRHEPEGRSGFAHLFEHLMFNGSENAPGDFFAPLKEMGASDYNGSTYFDRTNYFETVPVGGLERTLFLESDRMGWLNGAITQDVLDVQRGVVQNEKRQGDNRPYGLVQYALTEGLFPAGHPYAHTPIGSMADLDAASLADVKAWFHDHYGPNNAVLVLAGDIDAATARPLVERYFGAIARGPRLAGPAVPVTPLAAPVTRELTDRVATTLILRSWVVPGLDDADAVALDVAAGVLGGLASSRLDDTLVRGENLAVSAAASNNSLARAGTFTIQAMVRPGVDPEDVRQRLDAILADFLRSGPSADEVRRVATMAIAGTLEGLESVSEKASMLAEGELYEGRPDSYRRQLDALAAMTPEKVRAVSQMWLAGPAQTIIVTPGARPAYAEADGSPARSAATGDHQASAAPVRGPARAAMPPLAAEAALTVPAISRMRLSNGIEVIYSKTPDVPMTRLALSLDAGSAADPQGGEGTQALMLAMLEEGGAGMNASQLASAKERLGARIDSGTSFDRTTLSLVVPSANLHPALALFARTALQPGFEGEALARCREQLLAGIAQRLSSPAGLASRELAPRLYGDASPYARAMSPGNPEVVRRLDAQDLRAFHAAWFRPEKARIFVTSDRAPDEVKGALETAFGTWTAAPGTASGLKDFHRPDTVAAPAIVLVDRPDSPQSQILAGFPSRLAPQGDTLAAEVANEALGGDFLARLNMNLREDKHWSYSVRGSFQRSEHAMPYVVNAPVQADRTGDTIRELRTEIADFRSTRPMTQTELDGIVAGAVRALPGTFAGPGVTLGAMQRNDLLGRPDDYYATLGARYRELDLGSANAAFASAFDPESGIWVVVGDARIVRPQLEGLGLPVIEVPGA